MITTTEGPNKGYGWSWCKALSPFLPQLLYYRIKTVWTTLMYLMACTTFGSIEEQFDNWEIHTNFFTIYCSWMNGFFYFDQFSVSFIHKLICNGYSKKAPEKWSTDQWATDRTWELGKSKRHINVLFETKIVIQSYTIHKQVLHMYGKVVATFSPSEVPSLIPSRI